MEFEVLGRLAARRDGVDVALGWFKQRSLLALLLIHANEVVATDRIIDELWGDQPASDRQNALWVHVSNLRSALEPAREKRSEGTLLLTRPPGLRAAGRSGRARRLEIRAVRPRGAGPRRHRSGGCVDRARRGSGAVSGSALRGRGLRAVRPARVRAARGASPRSRGPEHRRRSAEVPVLRTRR
jgi:hypothetical protein